MPPGNGEIFVDTTCDGPLIWVSEFHHEIFNEGFLKNIELELPYHHIIKQTTKHILLHFNDEIETTVEVSPTGEAVESSKNFLFFCHSSAPCFVRRALF